MRATGTSLFILLDIDLLCKHTIVGLSSTQLMAALFSVL